MHFATRFVSVGAVLITIGIHAQASILWQGNFETGDMSQWDSPINVAGR